MCRSAPRPCDSGPDPTRGGTSRITNTSPEATAFIGHGGCSTLSGCAGLLHPSLFVHPENEQPHNQRSCPEEGENCNIRKRKESERQKQKGQPTQTSNHRHHPQNPRQEGGPDNEVAR